MDNNSFNIDNKVVEVRKTNNPDEVINKINTTILEELLVCSTNFISNFTSNKFNFNCNVNSSLHKINSDIANNISMKEFQNKFNINNNNYLCTDVRRIDTGYEYKLYFNIKIIKLFPDLYEFNNCVKNNIKNEEHNFTCTNYIESKNLGDFLVTFRQMNKNFKINHVKHQNFEDAQFINENSL
jgi:hypothetical protein